MVAKNAIHLKSACLADALRLFLQVGELKALICNVLFHLQKLLVFYRQKESKLIEAIQIGWLLFFWSPVNKFRTQILFCSQETRSAIPARSKSERYFSRAGKGE